MIRNKVVSMETLSSITEKSAVECTVKSSDQPDLSIAWMHLYSQCSAMNRNLDEDLKLINIAHLVKVYHSFVEQCMDPSVTTVTAPTIDTATQCSISEENVSMGHAEDSSFQKKLLNIKETSLKLKVGQYLFNLSKEFPAYDEKLHVCRNSEIFESFAEKFDLSNEQKNRLFKIWLPVNLSRCLEVKKCFDNDEWLHSDDVGRLQLLCNATEGVPTLDILNKLRIGWNECTFTFMSMYKRAYKAICSNMFNVKSNFIQKFKFLDPVTRVLASDKESILEAAKVIDIARRQESHREIPQNSQKEIKISKQPYTSKTYFNDEIYLERRKKIHVKPKSYFETMSKVNDSGVSVTAVQTPKSRERPRIRDPRPVTELSSQDRLVPNGSKADVLTLINNKIRKMHKLGEPQYLRNAFHIVNDFLNHEVFRPGIGIG
ncbi:uncharacterized protein [Dendropsophus ebraccatus]|uniref:uncharacterized protein n=1 Tax=Dendropsophus ebraccatus TaxID=150705 RepID=UPI0038322359